MTAGLPLQSLAHDFSGQRLAAAMARRQSSKLSITVSAIARLVMTPTTSRARGLGALPELIRSVHVFVAPLPSQRGQHLHRRPAVDAESVLALEIGDRRLGLG